MNPFLEAAIRSGKNRYLIVAAVCAAWCFYLVSYFNIPRVIHLLIIFGVIGFTCLYRAFDRPKRLRRLFYREPERIVRGYIEYRYLPWIRRWHMTYLHLIDVQGRNHALTAKDASLINLIEEIKLLSPRIDWHSGSGVKEE